MKDYILDNFGYFPSFRSIAFVTLLFLFSTSLFAQPDTITLGLGNISNMSTLTSDPNSNSSGSETINGHGMLANENAVSRFFAQATLGVDYDTIQANSDMSFSSWIDSQFNTSRAFNITNYARYTIKELIPCIDTDTIPIMHHGQYWRRYWQTAWWQYTMTSPDLLRNRVALALSEIFVVSECPDLEDVPLGLANYYDMLLDNAFGNFEDLLKDVTLHPTMGVYLTHVNSPKSSTTNNTFPDENYARELMQLFTIGLHELNLDGTLKLDSSGNAIRTYDDHNDISNFAKIFTGLTYGNKDTFPNPGEPKQVDLLQPMKMFDCFHEPGEKHLLNGFVVPDRNPVDGMADIDTTLNHLFNHPNVGPFISYRLIQRLVRSNPTPAYIARVATKFNDNGEGVRGDMKAVIKAILLDPEARACAFEQDATAGMLREPLLRYTHICRAFNASSASGLFRNEMTDFYDATLQKTLAATSVFNFFEPDFQPIGTITDNDLVAPEFQIFDALTVSGYINQLHDWVFEDNKVMSSRHFCDNDETAINDVNLNLEDELNLGGIHQIDELLERLNLILTHGNMTAETKATIKEGLELIDDNEIRVKTAIFLVMISPDYLILR